MRLAVVIGTVVCTVKDPRLEGKKMLIIHPIDRRGERTAASVVALDSVGAGIGERVYYVRGKEAAFPWSDSDTPADCTVVGILDASNFKPLHDAGAQC